MDIISKIDAEKLGLAEYFTGKSCKNGHVCERKVIGGYCVECRREYSHRYTIENKEKIKKRSREHYEKNKDSIAAKAKARRSKNIDEYKRREKKYRDKPESKELRKKYMAEYVKDPENRAKLNNCTSKWKNNNKDKVNKKQRERASERRKSDEYKAKSSERSEYQRKYREANKERLSKRYKAKKKITRRSKRHKSISFIRSHLRRVLDLSGKNKNTSSEVMVGYSRDKLISRIEFNFKDGMSWDNYGEWHIDHKVSVSRFIDKGVTDPKIINALSNLQPLWARDNLIKGK